MSHIPTIKALKEKGLLLLCNAWTVILDAYAAPNFLAFSDHASLDKQMITNASDIKFAGEPKMGFPRS